MTFDIAAFDKEVSFDFDQPFQLEILHPISGEKTGLVVGVCSYRSERVKRVQRRLSNAAIREGKKNPKKVGTAEEIEEKTNEIVAAATVSWNMTREGVAIECTADAVLDIISQPKYFFIAEQIDKAADEDAHFTKPSPKN
ncbi:hypothetical protein [Phyllobacterium sp. P5_D12]